MIKRIRWTAAEEDILIDHLRSHGAKSSSRDFVYLINNVQQYLPPDRRRKILARTNLKVDFLKRLDGYAPLVSVPEPEAPAPPVQTPAPAGILEQLLQAITALTARIEGLEERILEVATQPEPAKPVPLGELLGPPLVTPTHLVRARVLVAGSDNGLAQHVSREIPEAQIVHAPRLNESVPGKVRGADIVVIVTQYVSHPFVNVIKKNLNHGGRDRPLLYANGGATSVVQVIKGALEDGLRDDQ